MKGGRSCPGGEVFLLALWFQCMHLSSVGHCHSQPALSRLSRYLTLGIFYLLILYIHIFKYEEPWNRHLNCLALSFQVNLTRNSKKTLPWMQMQMTTDGTVRAVRIECHPNRPNLWNNTLADTTSCCRVNPEMILEKQSLLFPTKITRRVLFYLDRSRASCRATHLVRSAALGSQLLQLPLYRDGKGAQRRAQNDTAASGAVGIRTRAGWLQSPPSQLPHCTAEGASSTVSFLFPREMYASWPQALRPCSHISRDFYMTLLLRTN